MNFDEWFKIVPHPFQSEAEIAFMREEYRYVWDAAVEQAASVAEGWDYPLLASDIRQLADIRRDAAHGESKETK